MGKKTKASSLGRALIRDRFNHGNRRTVDNNSMVSTYHTVQMVQTSVLKTIFVLIVS